jgi:hypothetical protein
MNTKRVFILGAGFSKQAGMPLATELLPFVENEFKKYNQDDAISWLDWLKRRINWLEESSSSQAGGFNIEQVFDLAYFDVMAWRLKHHTCKLGRNAGDVPWRASEDISAWLNHMEDDLRDIIWTRQKICQQNAQTISEFVKHLRSDDVVLTFNYDTLLESCISEQNIDWWYGFELERKKKGIAIFKMHGSINWILAPRNKYENFGYTLLFKKGDKNREEANFPSGNIEWDYVLLRVPDTSIATRIENRDLQSSEKPYYLAIGGLGRYKPLDKISGLGEVWVNAMRFLLKAEQIYIIGFSLSPFDNMARLCFAGAMCDRHGKKKPPPNITIVDPCDKDPTPNFQSVFGLDTPIKPLKKRAEDVDWAKVLI